MPDLQKRIEARKAAILARIATKRGEAGPIESEADTLRLKLSIRQGVAGYRASCDAIRKRLAELESDENV